MTGDLIQPRWDFRQPTAVQMRVTLIDIEPAIWRRLVVPRGFHLGQLHHVIQAAFGWLDYHLHEFEIGGLSYGDLEQIGQPEFVGDRHGLDESMVQLIDFSRAEQIGFVYLYDFGDHWKHRIEFERQLVLEPAPRAATCVDGARARPPEDVGGVGGYENFLRSSPIRLTLSTRIRRGGLVVIPIPNGSIWHCATRTCATPFARLGTFACTSHRLGVGREPPRHKTRTASPGKAVVALVAIPRPNPAASTPARSHGRRGRGRAWATG